MAHNCQGDQADSLEQSNKPVLCSMNCGFFANPACNNMCSKCYRDSQMSAERKISGSKAAPLTDVAHLPEFPDVLVAEKAVRSPQRIEFMPPSTVKAPADTSKVEVPEPEAEATEKSEPACSSSTPERHRPPQKNVGRCFVCNKKVGLTGFKCRCEYVFCGAHRLAEAHECSFDYKQAGRLRLAENNPLIQGSKMDKL